MELQRLTWDSELYYTPNAVLLLDRPLDYDVADADIAGRLIVGLIEDPRPLNSGKERRICCDSGGSFKRGEFDIRKDWQEPHGRTPKASDEEQEN